MNAEKTIRSQARTLLSKGNWSQSLGVFFILFAGIMLVLFVQSILVLGAELAVTPLFDNLAEHMEVFDLSDEDSIGFGLLTIIQSFFGYLAYALGFLFLFPLYCGVKRYFYLMSKDESNGISDVFYYLTKKFKKTTGFGLRFGLLSLLKMLPCFAPVIILMGVMTTNEFSTLANSILTISAIIFGIAGFLLWMLWTSRQFLSIYLFIEDDSLPSGTYPRESAKIINNMLNSSVRKLNFSFIGWLLLALTGVGMLYFVPYYETSLAISAKWMIKLQKEV